jgi:putative peptidoglycan lipid II flippase
LHIGSNWWHEFSARSHNRKIFGAMMTIGTLTVGVKILSMIKDMATAAWFGRGDGMDAFVIAFMVPSLAIVVISGSFNAALIPAHVDVQQKEGEMQAQKLFSSTVALSLSILLLVTLGLALLGPTILRLLTPGFSPEKLLMTQRLFYLLLPIIPLSGLLSNWESVLNASERFGMPAIAPAMVSIGTIGVLVLCGTRLGIDALAVGTVTGIGLNLLLLGWALKRRGIRLLPRWHGWTPAMKRVAHQYLPLAAAALLMGCTQFVDQGMASLLPPGSVAALSYGNKLVFLTLTAGTMALSTAVLPYFSKMVATSSWQELRHTLVTYMRLILLVTIPLTLLGLCFSSPLISLLFQRGKFGAEDVRVVSAVQSMYMLQIPFYTLGILFVRMISSLQLNHFLLWNTTISLSVCVVLDYVLMHLMGIAGIALATTLVYMVSCTVLAIVLFRRLAAIERRETACG